MFACARVRACAVARVRVCSVARRVPLSQVRKGESFYGAEGGYHALAGQVRLPTCARAMPMCTPPPPPGGLAAGPSPAAARVQWNEPPPFFTTPPYTTYAFLNMGGLFFHTRRGRTRAARWG